MKNVALVFSHNDSSAIKLYTKELVKFTDKTPSLSTYKFVLVISPTLLEDIQYKFPGIGVMPVTDINRFLFDHTLDCSTVLLGLPENKYESALGDHLLRNIKPPTYKLDNGIVFESIYDACDGYGASAQQMLLELSRDRLVSFKPCRVGMNANELADPKTTALLNGFPLGKYYIQYAAPIATESFGAHKSASSVTCSYTMFESTRIPKDWSYFINQFNKLIVPSVFCRDVFRQCGVNIETHVVPLGVNPKFWPLCSDRKRQDRPFRFLLFANSHWNNNRKNYPLTLQMFNNLFANNPKVELILKLTTGMPPQGTNLPSNVKVLTGRYNQDGLVSLIHQCDCVLSASSGEGAGLAPIEAACTGAGTIYTDWGGLSDLARTGIGAPVRPKGLKPAHFEDHYLRAANGGSGHLGDFADIDTDAFSDRMKWAFQNRDKILSKGIDDSRTVRECWTYENTVSKLVKAVGIND